MKGAIGTAQRVVALLFISTALSLAQANIMSDQATENAQGSGEAGEASEAAKGLAPVGPGTINYVEGQVSIDGRALLSSSVGSTSLRPGQTLATQEGYAEVLLTPGSFLRVGKNSELRLTSAGLADTRVDFVRGSGMLEVDQLIKGTGMRVGYRGATMVIEQKGLYNFDGALPAFRVLDGKAVVEEAGETKSLGKHIQVLLAGDGPIKKKNFDKKTVENEPLYVWSKARSEDEAQVNFTAANNPDAYASAGPGWYWDPYLSTYGFWPVAGSLYSPFGFGFYSPGYFGLYGGGYPLYGLYRRPGWHARSGRWHGHSGGWHNGARGGRSGWQGRTGGGFHEAGRAGGAYRGAGGSRGGGHH